MNLRRLAVMAVFAVSLAVPAAAQEVWPAMKLKPEWKADVDAVRAKYCKERHDYRPRLSAHQVHAPFGEYMSYAKFYRWAENYRMKFDEKGVPQLLVKDKLYYNPLTVMQFILTRYSEMVASGSTTPPADMNAAVDRLMQLQSKDTGGFHYKFPKVYYVTRKEMPAGWVSGMTQGVSLSVFARLYHLTKDRRYIEAGNRAFDFMMIPTTEGGTRSSLAGLHPSLSSYVTFEEYIAHPSTYTLNGFIYTTVGLYDWSQLREAGKHQALAAKYYKESIRTLEQILPYYDVGGFSTYDMAHVTHNLTPHFGTSYHRNHIELLELLYAMTGSRWFRHFADSWAVYADTACYDPAAAKLAAAPPAAKKPAVAAEPPKKQ